MFGRGVDTRELHDIIHRAMPDADIPGRSALRAGTHFGKAAAGAGGQLASKVFRAELEKLLLERLRRAQVKHLHIKVLLLD